MEDKLFDELLKSVKEGGQIIRGEKPPSRIRRVGKPKVIGSNPNSVDWCHPPEREETEQSNTPS